MDRRETRLTKAALRQSAGLGAGLGKRCQIALILSALMLVSGLAAASASVVVPLVVITDMEPDDRIALHLIAAFFPDRLALVGTTVMHSYRKKLLAERLLLQLNMSHVPVVQGSGGVAASYAQIASSAAARAYDHEGEGILDQATLAATLERPRSSSKLQKELRTLLQENPRVEILLLAPPTDLAQVLTDNPDLIRHVDRVHLMGGWVARDDNNETTLRTTYNWNMDPVASKLLLEFENLPITLYSSDLIKGQFSGGSVSSRNYGDLIELLRDREESMPSVAETMMSAASWDNHVMDSIPALEAVIGRDNAGAQFSPADPIVAIGAFEPALVTRRTAVRIKLYEQELDARFGYRIVVTPCVDSNVQMIEDLDEQIFRELFVQAFDEP